MEKKDNSGLLILSIYLRVNKVSLVVVEASPAEVTVGQRLLQEVSSIQLMPSVLDLEQVRKSVIQQLMGGQHNKKGDWSTNFVHVADGKNLIEKSILISPAQGQLQPLVPPGSSGLWWPHRWPSRLCGLRATSASAPAHFLFHYECATRSKESEWALSSWWYYWHYTV